MNLKYKCCIFDLDGTIINTIHALTYTTNLVMAKFGLRALSEEEMMRIVGDGYKMQIKRSLIACGDSELENYEAALSIYKELFAKTCLYQLEPYEGMRELLDRMKKAGMKLFIFTNKPHERAIENVEFVYGKDYFDYILGEQDGLPKKPDPKGVHIILDKFGFTKEQCLYMGDTNTDMKTAIAAGVDAVGAVWGFRGEEELASFSPKYMAQMPLDVAALIGLEGQE